MFPTILMKNLLKLELKQSKIKNDKLEIIFFRLLKEILRKKNYIFIIIKNIKKK